MKYFETDKDSLYIYSEFLEVRNLKENKECKHQHTEIKKMVHCLFSYDRFDKGWELVYVLKPICKKYYSNCCKEKSCNKTFPEIEFIRFYDPRFPEVIKKQIKKSYNYYRKRYNPNLPEDFFEDRPQLLQEECMSDQSFEELKTSFKEAVEIEKALTEAANLWEQKDKNRVYVNKYDLRIKDIDNMDDQGNIIAITSRKIPINNPDPDIEFNNGCAKYDSNEQYQMMIKRASTRQTLEKCCNFEPDSNPKNSTQNWFEHLKVHGLDVDKMKDQLINGALNFPEKEFQEIVKEDYKKRIVQEQIDLVQAMIDKAKKDLEDDK